MTTASLRRIAFLCLLLGVAAVTHRSALARDAPAPNFAQGSPRPLLFAVRFQPGPGWDKAKPPADQIGFASHSANLQRLRREGAIVLGGRFADLGLVVVTARDLDAARALFAGDETIAAEVFSMQVDPWATIFEGCTSGVKGQSS
jgi:uncharacterized protein YciI